MRFLALFLLFAIPIRVERPEKVPLPHVEAPEPLPRYVDPILPDGTQYMVVTGGLTLRDENGCWHVYESAPLDAYGGYLLYVDTVCEDG